MKPVLPCRKIALRGLAVIVAVAAGASWSMPLPHAPNIPGGNHVPLVDYTGPAAVEDRPESCAADLVKGCEYLIAKDAAKRRH